ncbi:MAG: hypothetical protein EOP06_03755 [Proteobacteria bacterium]|nr:MAG: hypothetical protein EOP06_03755 [Pseudomonadota bacterium]
MLSDLSMEAALKETAPRILIKDVKREQMAFFLIHPHFLSIRVFATQKIVEQDVAERLYPALFKDLKTPETEFTLRHAEKAKDLSRFSVASKMIKEKSPSRALRYGEVSTTEFGNDPPEYFTSIENLEPEDETPFPVKLPVWMIKALRAEGKPKKKSPSDQLVSILKDHFLKASKSAPPSKVEPVKKERRQRTKKAKPEGMDA